MKKKLVIVGALLIGVQGAVHGVGEKSVNSDGSGNSTINFYGTLETHEGHIYPVQEITFNKLVKLIPVFEMPSQESFALDSSDKNVRILKKNPAENLVIAKFNLAGTSIIAVPYPDIRWYYKRNLASASCPIECKGNERPYKIAEDPGSLKYIQIQVTNKEGKKEDYLVEANKIIYCKEKNALKSEDVVHTIQLPAIKTLTINGYHKREEEKESRHENKKNEEHKEKVMPQISTDQQNSPDTLKTSSRNKRMRSTKIVRVSQAN